MALEFVPGVARIACNGTYRGTNWTNVFHWEKFITAHYEQAEMDELVGLWRTAFVTHLLGRMSTSATLTSVVATDLTNINGVVSVNTSTANGALNAVTYMPGNVAIVISWKIARHYRGGHPRTYLSGQPAESATDGKVWAAAHVSALATAANQFLTAVNAFQIGGDDEGGELTTVHRIRAGANIVPPITSPIVQAIVDNRIDSQRRRLGPDVNG
jgi:hypothetical protein